jgi:CheY-like chemotaxis protein
MAMHIDTRRRQTVGGIVEAPGSDPSSLTDRDDTSSQRALSIDYTKCVMPSTAYMSYPDPAVSGAADRPKILIVEDDYLVALDIETSLIEAGFAVTGIARSAEEAEQLAARHGPRLVVMDIHLAGRRDGVDAALAIFRAHGIRSIFATAHKDDHTQARARPAAPLGWVSKPYSVDCLVALAWQALADLDAPQ